MTGWLRALNFLTLTGLVALLIVFAVAWARVPRRAGREGHVLRRFAQLFVVLAGVFTVFWLVRFNTIVELVPVRVTYALLQDWIWLLYLALAVAVARARP